MPDDIDTSDLATEFEALSRDEAMEAANRWYSTSQEALFAGGDEHGYEVENVARGALPPQWDSSLGGFAFHYPHEASRYFNAGTAPHEIEGDPTLVFPWEEAPQEVREKFEDTFPIVFLPKVDVDGIEAIRYFERGEQAALKYWEQRTGGDARQLTRGRYQ